MRLRPATLIQSLVLRWTNITILRLFIPETVVPTHLADLGAGGAFAGGPRRRPRARAVPREGVHARRVPRPHPARPPPRLQQSREEHTGKHPRRSQWSQ